MAAEYIDKSGDSIDLTVILGVYRTRSEIVRFFKLCTNYNDAECQNAADYILENITPEPCTKMESKRIRKRIEAEFCSEPWHASKTKRMVVAGICAILFFGILFFSPPAFITKLITGAATVVSETQFNNVDNGMTYEEVKNLFGGDGSLLSSYGNVEIYKWPGNGMLGSNCNVSFQDKRAYSKAQFGLR
ncbi:hypothetical protein NE562_11525 [Butyricicoccus faecihominis]|uniref:hypothetical protein n=1 Tax=Butyricicoccus faecihominis TaxID=1712515 RepID=UPI002478EDA8|nr:hypothetical protein [Butyricicoccus faecihominis]MCQ5130293.1 hypothetical protein [Butyricicoccus faecihominis]